MPPKINDTSTRRSSLLLKIDKETGVLPEHMPLHYLKLEWDYEDNYIELLHNYFNHDDFIHDLKVLADRYCGIVEVECEIGELLKYYINNNIIQEYKGEIVWQPTGMKL